MTPELGRIRLSEVVFDPVIYPRKDHNPELVQRYATVIGEIESAQRYISLSSNKKLLDGKHRWLAYRKHYGEKDVEIPVLIYPIQAEHDLLRIAVKLNSDHGYQLSEADKEMSAKALFAYGLSYEDIAKDLSVGKAQVSKWLSRTVKDQKVKRNQAMFDMWMACHTQEEIAKALDVSQSLVRDFSISVLGNQTTKTTEDDTDGEDDEAKPSAFAKRGTSPAALHQTDFEVPLYNVWKQQTKTQGASHFGNSEVRWVDNLLYLYTQPFDVVVDPFAGGGSTIDICKKRFRRYFVSDRKPVPEREHQIRQHDLTQGLPKAPWKDVRLVYLDPPYWRQAAGKYSDDPTDLANMSLEDFTKSLTGIINGYAGKLASGAIIALILQPTQWNAPEHKYTDHVADMIKAVKLPIDLRIQAPYESQQYNAQMVDWAKANKKVLVLSREIIVWKVA